MLQRELNPLRCQKESTSLSMTKIIEACNRQAKFELRALCSSMETRHTGKAEDSLGGLLATYQFNVKSIASKRAPT